MRRYLCGVGGGMAGAHHAPGDPAEQVGEARGRVGFVRHDEHQQRMTVMACHPVELGRHVTGRRTGGRVVMKPVQHVLHMRLATAQPDVHAPATVTEDHAQLIGTPQRDQSHRADDVSGHVTLQLT